MRIRRKNGEPARLVAAMHAAEPGLTTKEAAERLDISWGCVRKLSAQLRLRFAHDVSGPAPQPIAERFWANLKMAGDNDCWIWTGRLDRKGYGILSERVDRRPATRQAHRISWILHHGPIPDGMCICHRCDNPPCCNPRHLFLGSHYDNITDAVKKGRHAHGSRHGSARLTPSQVRAILRSNKSNVELAQQFSVADATVSDIRHRRTWRHISDQPEA